MDTKSTTSPTTQPSMRDSANDAAKDAREGMRDIGKAASAASGDLQKDLQALRDDFGRLAEQVRGIVSDKGSAAWQRAKSSMDGVMSDAQAKGQEAVGAVREVSNNFTDAVDESIRTRPYTTLAVVAGLGFVLGATWRR